VTQRYGFVPKVYNYPVYNACDFVKHNTWNQGKNPLFFLTNVYFGHRIKKNVKNS